MKLSTALRIASTRPPPLLAAMAAGDPVILERTQRLHRLHAKAKEILAAHGGAPLASDHVEDIPVKKPKDPKPKKHGKQPPPSPTDEPDDTPRAPGAPRPGSKRADGEDPEPTNDDEDHDDDGDEDEDEDESTADHDRAPRRKGKQDKRKPAEPKKEEELAAIASANAALARARAFIAAQNLARRRAKAKRQDRAIRHADRVLKAGRLDDRARVDTLLRLHSKKPERVDYATALEKLTKAGLTRRQQGAALVMASERGHVDTSMVATGVRWDSWGREVK